ncbi:MAG: diguanylate cyclase [Anaerovorax sp.]|nr:diguanylate cyclase [Anaerovorax sp.]
MKIINQVFFDINSKENKNEFSLKIFIHNNLCILILAFYLTLEQLYYGFFLTQYGQVVRTIHFFTAFIMVFYFLLAVYFNKKKLSHLNIFHKAYELSFGIYGFAVAILRALVVKNNVFALPTVYIAVIYGFAVFFYFHPLKSFFIYSVTSVMILFLLPIFKPEILYSTYIYDILSNNIIAWFASVIGYHRYRKEFINQKTIYRKNKMLQAKTNEIEKINEELRYSSIMDSLTDIYNRRQLNQLLKNEYIRCAKVCKKCSLILLDIDFFKSINDTYGHNVGDKVLVEVALLLKRSVRERDSVGRWGGEEFLIICPETNFETAYRIAEKIRVKIENFNFRLEDKVTCSFGVTTNKKVDTVLNLIQRADRGLYKAKENGRNRVEKGE